MLGVRVEVPGPDRDITTLGATEGRGTAAREASRPPGKEERMWREREDGPGPEVGAWWTGLCLSEGAGSEASSSCKLGGPGTGGGLKAPGRVCPGRAMCVCVCVRGCHVCARVWCVCTGYQEGHACVCACVRGCHACMCVCV